MSKKTIKNVWYLHIFVLNNYYRVAKELARSQCLVVYCLREKGWVLISINKVL